MARRLIAELVGTAILVYFGCGAATLMLGFHLAALNTAVATLVIALTFGLVLVGIAYAFGPISGGHVNPAVTLGALLAGRIGVADAVAYWVAQVVGAFLGALALLATFSASPLYHRSTTGLGVNGYGLASSIGIRWGGAFLLEVVMTAVFVYVILAVTAKNAGPGLVIGLTLGVMHLLGVSIDGTSVNPARSLAPAVIVGGTALKQVWVFLTAPLVGGLVAAAAFRAMHPEDAAGPSDVAAPTAPASPGAPAPAEG